MPRGHRFALEFECEQHVKGRQGVIEVDARDLLGLEWRTERGRVVHGCVLERGRPVPDVMVYASTAEGTSTSAISGDDGSFVVGGLLGEEATVELGSSLYDSPLGTIPLDHWQAWRAHPRGMVVDSAGAPVAGAIVAYLGIYRSQDLWQLAEATVAPGLTGTDGSFDFEIDELRESDCFNGCMPMLVALRPGGGEAAAVYTPDAPVRLQIAPRGTIVARVRDGESRPVCRVGLTFAPSSYETLEFFDSEDGVFVQAGLFPGIYDIKACFGEKHASARIELGAGETRSVELLLT